MIRPVSIALTVMVLAAPAMAETPTLLLFRQVSPPQLWIYDSDGCDEASAVECTLIAMQCASIGSLSITVNGLYREELSQWMDGGGTLNVTGIPGLSTLAADKSSMSDLDGLWSISFQASYERPKVDKETFGPELAFDIVYGKVVVTLGDSGTDLVRAFLSGCGDGPARSG
jgi:hypothetical protein